MRSQAYIPAFHMNHIKEPVRIQTDVLPLRFWPQLCNKSNQQINCLES